MGKYPPLPLMTCELNCGECCTIVLCSEGELQRVERFVSEHDLQPIKDGLNCPWLGSQKECRIYPVRPGICRWFGFDEGLECPRGHGMIVGAGLRRRWKEALGSPTRALHEVFPDWKQVLSGM
jgi:Fe-S-cluster containining protein